VRGGHLGYLLSGRMGVFMDDGTEAEAGPGDIVSIPPGHDAEIAGDENCVVIDFTGFETYTKRE
jgi:ethanolamine utilization protein EutQ (cupin superfamily)